MYEALIPCLDGLQLAVSDSVPQGSWVATGSSGVVATGSFAIISIPKEADTIHLNIDDFDALKSEYERTPQ